MAGRDDDGSRQQASQLLAAWTNGDQAARDELLPLVYAELRRLAHHYTTLDENQLAASPGVDVVVALDDALEQLSAFDSRKAQVVELKYFGGLNYDEIAEVLKISRITVRRDWEFAKVWLYTELRSAE